ncbi:MAG: hypothetical protein KF795_27075 [Labilithrix sp.]|nr:hypothetical protein [Labilithrix sp.]
MRSSVIGQLLVLLLAGAGSAAGCTTFGVTEPAEPAEPIEAGAPPSTGDGGDDAGERDAGDVDAGLIVYDTFSRNESAELGAADFGGTWVSSPGGGSLSVASGVGRIVVAKGSSTQAYMDHVDQTDVELEALLSGKSGPVSLGSGVYVSLVARRHDGFRYNGKIVLRDNGSVGLSFSKFEPSKPEADIVTVAHVLDAPESEPLRVRFQFVGARPTRLRGKVWKAADAEPAGWTTEVTDATDGLQQGGSLGVHVFLSTLAAASTEILVDDFVARTIR